MTIGTRDWEARLESFSRRGDLLHGWGTLHGCGTYPRSAWLEVANGGRIPVVLGTAAPHRDGNQVAIDFVLYGSLRASSGTEALHLVLDWPDPRQVRIAMPPPRLAPPGGGIARILAMPWKHYFVRGWRLVRQRQVGVLLRKLAGMTAATLTSGWPPERLLNWAATEGKPLALVIDHDLGGGANVYRHSLVTRLAEDGFVPLLLSAHHGILSYQLSAQRGKRVRMAHVEDIEALFGHLFADANIRCVVFNNILSFPAPIDLVAELTRWLRRRQPERFLFLVHDYYSICPVWLLLDQTGRYCGIPEPAVCATCLNNNTALFLEFAAGADIESWRSAWRSLLKCATEIRCFSGSSRTLMLRAHPELDQNRLTVVPHQLEHARLRPIRLKDSGHPVIGVIGRLVAHKGSGVIKALAEHIRGSNIDAHIVIVGTIDVRLPDGVATVTGPYRPERLPDILEEHGVNVGFFSSICPETFSYVTEEMMAMDLPLVAFDIGAPGERIARYHRGHVIPITMAEPRALLDRIVDQYMKHVRRSAAHSGQ